MAQNRRSAIFIQEDSARGILFFAKEMVKSMNRLAILALSVATAMSGIPPAGAFPIVPTVKSQAADVERVQFSYERGENYKNDRCRNPVGSCRGYRDRHYRYGRYRDRDHYRYGYRDRGYRDRYHRRYYRDRDSNVGALIGGLAAGAIIGGLLAQPRYPAPRYYGGGNGHTRWCYARYRSYRAYDNTFQPYHGPRRQCISPYL